METISIFFAAGRGTRLRPLTDKTPKPLIKVGDKALIEYSLEKLFSITDRYVIVINWLKEEFPKTLGDSFRGKSIEYVFQESPKGGTLDALRQAIFFSSQNLQSNYLVSNSDILVGEDFYTQLSQSIFKDPNLGCICAKFDEDLEKLKSMGIIKKDKLNNFQEIVEKPQEFISNLYNIGLYYFPNKIKDLIPKKSSQKNKEEFITDLINTYAQSFPLKIIESTAFRDEITSPEDFERLKNYSGF